MTVYHCKKCLLEKIDPLGILETVRRKVELIPADERASEDVYYRRLDTCSECSELNLGTCNMCGCFVEYRAATINGKCPKNRW